MPTAIVIDGHPNPHSFTAAIAAAYAEGYGATVLALRDLEFDVHMRHGYTAHMPLEPDLAAAKRAVHAAHRVVVVTPLWWGSVPALLKGFFDRALLPREEYSYHPSGLPNGYLKGRNGRLILLADTPWFAVPFIGLPAVRAVRKQTMAFVGLRTSLTRILGIKHSSAERRQAWLDKARAQGAADRRRDESLPEPTAHPEPFADEVLRR